MTTSHANSMIPLVTERLVLRRFIDGDAHALASYRNDPDVARYQSWERCSLAEAKAMITEFKHRPFGNPGEWIQLAIALRATDHLIGDVAMKLQHHDPRQAVVGFTIARNHQRRGYAREILMAIYDHFFTVMGLHRISADCDPRNAASWGLMESLGMRREAHHLKNLWFKGEWGDEYIYAILHEEWMRRRTR